MSAAGRAYGVICADRGGGRFELTDGERHLLWTLGKTAALVATARIATRQQERSQRLAERLGLAREIHERVLQRLFGVSLALGAEQPLDAAERERCRSELQEAIGDLRARSSARSRRWPRTPARRSPRSSSAAAASVPCRSRSTWPRELERAARARAAGPVGARRGAAQRRQARRTQTADRGGARPRRATRSRSRSETTASGEAAARGAGWGCGWPRSRRSSRAGWWSSGRAAPAVAAARGCRARWCRR